VTVTPFPVNPKKQNKAPSNSESLLVYTVR